MEENCGGSQGLNWAVEPREREREIIINANYTVNQIINLSSKHKIYRYYVSKYSSLFSTFDVGKGMPV
jgi:hypothetical protein